MNENIHTLDRNPSLDGISELCPNIRYSEFNGSPLCLSLIRPWGEGAYPLVVFVQGSAWTKPNLNGQIPQLSELSRRGYVVATVDHRSVWEEGGEAPGFLYDVRAAIRYLRAHAAKFRIDPTKAAIAGTSSGGNTALMIGLTSGDAERRWDIGENLDQSSDCDAVIDCFGPTDLVRMVTEQYTEVADDMNNIMARLAGGLASKNLDKLAAISPINYIAGAKIKLPFLLLHGDADDCVLYSHTLDFYNSLCAHDFDVALYKISGAPHEGSFWSAKIWQIIGDFIDKKLKKA